MAISKPLFWCIIKMNWSELRKTIALVGINAIAFIFDKEWIMYAIGIDALVLGYEIKKALSG